MRGLVQSPLARTVLIGLGGLTFAIGVIALFIPLIPTTPFLLISSYCFSKGSRRLHYWMTRHPQIGPPIVEWETHGVVRKKAKIFASILIVSSLSFPVVLLQGIPIYARLSAAAIGLGVIAFLWTRPSEPPRGTPIAESSHPDER